MRFKARSERDVHSHSERSRGTSLRELENYFARSLDFAFAPLGMTTGMSLTRVIEALLFSAQKPLSIHEITAAIKAAEGDPASETPNEFARVKNAEVAAALEQLKVEYIQQSRAFQLVEKAEGWQLATDPGFAKWVRELFPAPKPARLSAPALETLAIIAYRQPITRADVEAVRGVNIDGVLQTLMERGLVKIAGRAEIPGRPLLYETTQFFLDHFGLRNLDELPNAEELRRRYLPVGQPVADTGEAGRPGSSAPATTNL
jgi:segregation and condensation protein B